MAYEIQFARITNSGKLSDRFLTCQHLKSADLAKSAMGELFALIEILSPWFPTAQVGKLIINNFNKYYYESGSTSDLVNFENSLKRINDDLAKITQEGETDWIGNLNGLLAAIIGGNLHLSSSGRIEAFIFRDGKVNHLTEGLSETTQAHPLKTFSNIISGQLKNHDKLLITNKELFNHLSLESIRQIITINNPGAAALQISRLLKKERTKLVNLIIINLIDKEELSTKAMAEEMESVYYLDKSLDSPLGKISNFWKNLALPVGKIVGSKFKIKRTPRATKSALPERALPGRVLPERDFPGKVLPAKPATGDKFEQEFIHEKDRDNGLLKDEEIKYSPDLYIHYYNASEQKKKAGKNRFNFLTRIIIRIFNFLSWLGLKIKNLAKFIMALARDRNRRKFLYIGIAAFLIIVIGLFIFFHGRGAKVGNLQSQKILDEAISLQKDGKNLLANGNPEKAKEQFMLSITKAQAIKDNSFVGQDAENLINSSYGELDKLTSTTRFNDLKPIITLNNETPKFFFVSGGESFLITDDSIFKANLIGGSPSKAASIPKGKGNFNFGAQSNNIIYLYTSDQNLYQFDPSTEKIDLVKMVQDGRWETANSMANYVGTIYLIDGILGQIYKHSSTQNEFSKGEEYVSGTNINLKQSISIAVDGSIYILKKNANDGQVIKLQKGRLLDFSLKGIPTPNDKIGQGVKIYTDADTPSIYVLDIGQKRILEFDKVGQFVHQYVYPDSFDKVSDFVVSAKARKIWLLDKNSVYEISI